MTPTSAPPGTRSVRSAARRVAVAVSAVVMLLASAVGSGAFGGTPIADAAGGALAADATPVAPDVPAFAVWSVIYVGLLALAGWQALGSQRSNARLYRLDPLIIASMLLNGAWILSIQAGWLAVSVALILLLLLVLAGAFRLTTVSRAGGPAEALLLDGTMGLYLGWVAVATVANIAAFLGSLGVGPGFGERTTFADVVAVIVLVVAGAVGVALARYGRGRFSVALSMVWGLAWIAVARTSGDLLSPPAAIAAAAAAVAIAITTIAARLARRR
jgi:hypothetical protein